MVFDQKKYDEAIRMLNGIAHAQEKLTTLERAIEMLTGWGVIRISTHLRGEIRGARIRRDALIESLAKGYAGGDPDDLSEKKK